LRPRIIEYDLCTQGLAKLILHACLAAKHRQAMISSICRRYLACDVPQASRVQEVAAKQSTQSILMMHGSGMARAIMIMVAHKEGVAVQATRKEFQNMIHNSRGVRRFHYPLCRIRDGCCVGKSFLKQHRRAGVATDFGYDHRGRRESMQNQRASKTCM
jgi:hypothetical protein